jgi:glycerol-3-phosphate dehydrogenase
MARKALRQVLSILERDSRIDPSFDDLPGKPGKPWARFLDEEVTQWPSRYSITQAQALQIARLYGERSGMVLGLLDKDPSLREPLHPDSPELSAQVVFAVRDEKAVHLEDVMLRRLEIGYTPHRWGKASEKASRLMADLLGWDEATRLKELERYRTNLYPAIPN